MNASLPNTTYGALMMAVQPSLVENISEIFWTLSACRGIEELPDRGGNNLYQPSEEFEVLEFGSEAAVKCAEWLESGDFQASRERAYLKIYFEFEKNLFPLSAETFLDEAMAIYKGRYEILSWNELPDTNYLEEYKKSVKGASVGASLWVGPPWDQAPEGKHPFYVEPGMAFGTGDHPTTKMCLEFIETLSKTPSFKPTRIVDIGTGSGILAVAARHFYPKAQILVTDLDPLCAQEVEKTFAHNKMTLEGLVQIYGPRADLRHNTLPENNAELLLSNIYAEVLTPLVPYLAALLKPGALWVVSGLLEGPVTQNFDNKAKEYFELVDSRTMTQEKAKLDAQQGLSKQAESWGARLFRRLTDTN